MDEFIGRIRTSDKKKRALEENFRAYRFPQPVALRRVSCYVPSSVGMHARTVTRASTNRSWYELLNKATTCMVDMDIECIEVSGRSKFLHINLKRDKRFIDYGNRWDRIECILTDVFGLEIRDHMPKRFRW